MTPDEARERLRERIQSSRRFGLVREAAVVYPWTPLADLMSMISEETYSAGWYFVLEFVLWRDVMNDFPPGDRRLMPLSGDYLQLAQLSLGLGGWVIARDVTVFENVFLTFDEWLPLYASWRASEDGQR